MSLTQKWQMAVIFGGMVTAFVILLLKLPQDSAQIAGAEFFTQRVCLRRRYLSLDDNIAATAV